MAKGISKDAGPNCKEAVQLETELVMSVEVDVGLLTESSCVPT